MKSPRSDQGDIHRRTVILGGLGAAVLVGVPAAVLASDTSHGTPSTSRKSPAADIKKGVLLATLDGTAEILSVAFSPDGKTVATTSDNDDGTVRLWDAATGRPVSTLIGYTPRSLNSIAFSPDGKTLAAGGENGAVQLWELSTGHSVATFTAANHGALIMSVAFSPDGKTLAAGDSDTQVQFWDVATGHGTATLPLADVYPSLQSVAFSPDGRTLAVGGSSGVTLWNVATGKTAVTLAGDRSRAACSVAFSPDGRTLAVANGGAFLWDVTTGQFITGLIGDTHQGVASVAFSPDGKTLAAGSVYDTVTLWDVATRQNTLTSVFTAIGRPMVLSPNGRTVAAFSTDANSVQLWSV
ncbi:WD40 repeat domain-containing protein [Catenulispora pinisilvae]|uniref:WD40 repeat domain-containing protein n=1 Tax=Catenulispora pinisilvae TaxID=2705253 RepID=UPI001890D635|nr:WD40 repeat domain-containing protein [Catenulispora pinisilvae]